MRRHMALRLRSQLQVIFCGAAFAVACEGGDDGSASSGAAAPSLLGTESSGATPERALPPPGLWQTWLDTDNLVSVFANQAMRGAVLEAIAQTGGFALVVGSDAGLEQLLSVRVEREPLEVALARILAGVPHALDYEKDPVSGVTRLARVRVGPEEALQGAAVSSPAPRPEAREPRRELTPFEREEPSARAERMWTDSLADLQSSDSEVRADAANWLNVNSAEGFQAATDRLANDESAGVRAAAAETLRDADVGAIQPLLRALEDPDPRVVMAALDALEFVGDESTVPHLAPLLKHRDVDVRERTVEAIEFLQ